ncbi:MAG: SMI1/KNR4 family protein [Minicystis sp.]
MIRTQEGAEQTSLTSIKLLEQRFGLKLPESYQQFLLTTNGGRPERDLILVPGCAASSYARIHFFFGVDDAVESCDLAWNIALRSDLPSGAIPIATTEGADIFCLTPKGGVLFWDGYENKPYPLADDFDGFLVQLYRDEHSPAFSSEETNQDRHE